VAPRRRALALLACAFACALPVAQAGKVYRWVDKNGVVHYGDRAPDAKATQGRAVKVIPV
jgi:hypothetical protein